MITRTKESSTRASKKILNRNGMQQDQWPTTMDEDNITVVYTLTWVESLCVGSRFRWSTDDYCSLSEVSRRFARQTKNIDSTRTTFIATQCDFYSRSDPFVYCGDRPIYFGGRFRDFLSIRTKARCSDRKIKNNTDNARHTVTAVGP